MTARGVALLAVLAGLAVSAASSAVTLEVEYRLSGGTLGQISPNVGSAITGGTLVLAFPVPNPLTIPTVSAPVDGWLRTLRISAFQGGLASWGGGGVLVGRGWVPGSPDVRMDTVTSSGRAGIGLQNLWHLGRVWTGPSLSRASTARQFYWTMQPLAAAGMYQLAGRITRPGFPGLGIPASVATFSTTAEEIHRTVVPEPEPWLSLLVACLFPLGGALATWWAGRRKRGAGPSATIAS